MIHLATKTLQAIENQIAADQGAAFRVALGKVIPHVGDAYRGEDSPFRSHLGASVLGGECGRALWYGFRWFTKPSFGGRTLRLFNRGHLEEARFIAMLLAIGCKIYQQDANGKQFRISDVNGHLGGSGDGVAVGIPDLPEGVPALLEFKTHNDASFKGLVKEGVRVAKFEHYVQMNLYMHKMGLSFALYLAVNKNNDDLYGEIMQVDGECAKTFLQRGHKIIFMHEAPPKLNESPGWFGCKWCDHRPVCHLGVNPERTCRSCKHADPTAPGGGWHCTKPDPLTGAIAVPKELTMADQLRACEHYNAL